VRKEAGKERQIAGPALDIAQNGSDAGAESQHVDLAGKQGDNEHQPAVAEPSGGQCGDAQRGECAGHGAMGVTNGQNGGRLTPGRKRLVVRAVPATTRRFFLSDQGEGFAQVQAVAQGTDGIWRARTAGASAGADR
jgi:hypothetical protein